MRPSITPSIRGTAAPPGSATPLASPAISPAQSWMRRAEVLAVLWIRRCATARRTCPSSSWNSMGLTR